MSTTTARPRTTKKYKALIAAGLDDTAALLTLGVEVAAPAEPVESVVDERIATLVAGGFSQEQAEKIVAEQDEPKAKKKGGKKNKGAKASTPELTNKERGEALVAERGLTFTRGRVYVTPEVIEAQVTVMKTGTPKVVQASGVGHVAAVLIYREESGDVAIQNLKQPV